MLLLYGALVAVYTDSKQVDKGYDLILELKAKGKTDNDYATMFSPGTPLARNVDQLTAMHTVKVKAQRKKTARKVATGLLVVGAAGLLGYALLKIRRNGMT